MPMKVLTVIGNRPQFIKAAAVSPPLRREHEEILVHTGQHFDDRLSAVFFAELGLPAPDRQLGINLGTASSQTARMLAALEPVLGEEAPDVVLVYGDTNSTLAGALAGAQARVPVAHVEAGMRSFDRSMPEELNRVLTDHASSLLLCSTEVAMTNLRHEARGRSRRARRRRHGGRGHGDPAPGARAHRPGGGAGRRAREYLLATAHRAGNVDDPERLARLVEVLTGLPLPVVLPAPSRAPTRGCAARGCATAWPRRRA